jgi:hypothetical protein
LNFPLKNKGEIFSFFFRAFRRVNFRPFIILPLPETERNESNGRRVDRMTARADTAQSGATETEG